MSKAEVKKYIKSLDRQGLEQLILDLYTVRKEAKEFLDYAVHPNDNAKYEQYKEVIKKEFGKNALLRGLNYAEGATQKERNNQIGGHKA